jgi:D-beta-D-heptose 7-phosphate kinase/D-beta-D-heptose 1-phosphate adenosyltransferase
MRNIESKIADVETLRREREQWRAAGKRVVFTNGCFDLLHAGHVDYLAFARAQGDVLVVGLNSDRSVRANKGADRPLVGQDDRARLLAALEAVDCVVIFDEDEPADLIAAVRPDVLVKGEDWKHYISGRDIVERAGGRVVLAPLVAGKSTTSLLERIRNLPR